MGAEVSSDDRNRLAPPGDSNAIEALISRYAPGVYRLAYAITRRDADAEKVLHEVFVQIVDKGVSLKRDVALRTWVYAITIDTSLNMRRGGCRHVATSLDELLPRYTADGHREGSRDYLVADWSGMPDRRLLEGEAREVLEEAICRLPDVYRAMLVLRDVEELSNEQVAEVVGCTVLEAKKRLHQARMAVREYLTRRLGGTNRSD